MTTGKLNEVFIKIFPNSLVDTLAYLAKKQGFDFNGEEIRAEMVGFCKKHVKRITRDMGEIAEKIGAMSDENLVHHLANVLAAQIVYTAALEGRSNQHIDKSDLYLAFYDLCIADAWDYH